MHTSPFLRARRAAALGVAALALLAGSAQAQSAAAKTPVIAVIDMDKVSSESLLGKSYAALIDKLRNEVVAARTKKQDDLNKLDATIKALQDEIEKQAQVLSPDALEKKRGELTKKGRDRQAFIEDGQQEMQRLEERAQAQAQAYNGEFQEKLRPIIETVVKDKAIDLLFDSRVTLKVNMAFDISQDVVVKADDAERAKPAAAAPKAN